MAHVLRLSQTGDGTPVLSKFRRLFVQSLPMGCRETTIPTYLLSTSKFTTHLPAAFLLFSKQHLLVWAGLSTYSRPFTGHEHLISKVLSGSLPYTQVGNNFKTTDGREGKVDGKMGDQPPSCWLLLLTTANFSLYAGPISCEQKQSRAPSPRRQAPTQKELLQSRGRHTCQESI